MLVQALSILTFLPAQAADCAVRAPLSELKTSVDAAETAFARLNRGEVLASTDAARATLPCLSEPLTVDVAARLHRALGLREFLDKDAEAARRSFAASRSLVPAASLPDWIAPAANPIQREFTAIALDTLRSDPVPPTTVHLGFDGRYGVMRPASVPTILQAFGADGAPTATWLLAPGDPLPAGVIVAPVAGTQVAGTQAAETTLSTGATHHGPNRALLAGSIGTAVVSGGLYALAFNARAHHTAATDVDTLDAAYTANHAFVVSSAGTAAVAVGLGVSAFLVTSW